MGGFPETYNDPRLSCGKRGMLLKKIGVKIEPLWGINLDLVVAKVKKDLSKLEIPF